MIIYGLVDPRDGRVRYVGFTSKTVEVRLRGHLDQSREGRTTHKSCWIRGLLKEGLEPVTILLEQVSEETWQARETFWISLFPDLTNMQPGGEGLINPSEEVRKKMGAARKAAGNFIGRPHTEEAREKIRAARAKQTLPAWTEERKAAASKSCKGRGQKPVRMPTREEKIEANRRYWLSPEGQAQKLINGAATAARHAAKRIAK